jgi:L-gulono-1,4-lactone dehydrogenase
VGDIWSNWAGDQECRPAEFVRPRDRAELAEVIAKAAEAGRKVSVIGAGHSFTEAAMTNDTMIDVKGLRGVIDADPATGLATVRGGSVLADLNDELHELGLAMANLGDIDKQTISGAISTGTHGTGAKLPNISAQVEGMDLVLADGTDLKLSADDDPELLRAARVSFGALAAISAVTLRCVPAFTLHRVDRRLPREEVLDTFQERADANEHFELFTFPYADSVLVLERNRVEGPARPRGRVATYLNDVVLENWALEAISMAGKVFPRAIPQFSRFAATLASGGKSTDRSDQVFANERRVRFTEMEYGVPREHGPEALRKVIDWIRSNRYPVFFPIEMRVTAADDAMLSPSHERDTIYIAVHQYRGMEWRPYFEAVEEIMNGFGGRPHWGKRHFQTAETLPKVYPQWASFQGVRDRLDPGRLFSNEYAARILGP